MITVILIIAIIVAVGAWMLRKGATEPAGNECADWGYERPVGVPGALHGADPLDTPKVVHVVREPVMVPVAAPKEPRLVEWLDVHRWIATLPDEDHVVMRSWHDLPAVNAMRAKHNCPPFERKIRGR